jgi:hypothetical protein
MEQGEPSREGFPRLRDEARILVMFGAVASASS